MKGHIPADIRQKLYDIIRGLPGAEKKTEQDIERAERRLAYDYTTQNRYSKKFFRIRPKADADRVAELKKHAKAITKILQSAHREHEQIKSKHEGAPASFFRAFPSLDRVQELENAAAAILEDIPKVQVWKIRGPRKQHAQAGRTHSA